MAGAGARGFECVRGEYCMRAYSNREIQQFSGSFADFALILCSIFMRITEF